MSQSLRLARQQGKVEDLAARFGLTLQTIHRDLADLASAGQLQRGHGGAVQPSGTVNLAHENRRALHREAKAAMARACAAMIPHKASVAINIGTSTANCCTIAGCWWSTSPSSSAPPRPASARCPRSTRC